MLVEKTAIIIYFIETNQGYKIGAKMVCFGDGFYYKPRVDIELLEEFYEGIIALFLYA